ncbi:hypothetical protein [Methylobacterium sp. D48H]
MSDVRHHQFVHIDGYGVQSRRKDAPRACISGITAEAARLPGACAHLAEVRPAHILLGMSPVEAGRIATGRAIFARDSRGRRLRSDGVAMLAVVASYPVPRSLVEAGQSSGERATYEAWRAKVLSWLAGLFGHNLLSVVEHHDEPFLHIHGIVVPDIGEDGRLRLDEIHPGRAAIARVTAEKGAKGVQRSAYVAAMRGIQDDFHTLVSSAFGHHRHGPKRQRRERQLHLAIKRVEERKEEIELEHTDRRAAFDEERRAILAGLSAEFVNRLRLAGAAIRADISREKDSTIDTLRQQVAEKQRIVDNAVVALKKVSLASQKHKSEKEQLRAEVDRLKALLQGREAEGAGFSFGQ